MFVFLTCIRHPATSNNYQYISELFNACARSVCGQTDSDFVLIVVCNEKPEMQFVNSKIKFIETNIKPPEGGRRNVLLDKAYKRLIGLNYANKYYQADYIMMLDADDLVSCYLVEDTIQALDSEKHFGGLRIDKGYMYDVSNQKWQRKYGMNRYCGSTLIFRGGLISAQFNIIDSMDENTIIEANKDKEQVLLSLFGDHQDGTNYFKRLGYPLLACKSFSTAWVINTGENLSKTKGKDSGIYPDKALLKHFSIIDSSLIKKNSVKDILREKYLLFKSYLAFIFRR